MGDLASVVLLESVVVTDSLYYEDVPVEILDCQVRRLRNKEVASVKVMWRSQSVGGATWQVEASMKTKYSHLFHFDCAPSGDNSSSSVFQLFMLEFNLRIMFSPFILAFLVYLHAFGTQFCQKLSSMCRVVGIPALPQF